MGRALFFYGIAGLASGSLFASVTDMTIQSTADTERRIQLSSQSRAMATLVRRIQSEYREMPGMKLTEAQARRLWDIDGRTCSRVLTTLVEQRFLKRTPSGTFVRDS